MADLKRYVKTGTATTKVDLVTTSLNLERRHVQFIKSLNLNLSRLIRDYIDTLIAEHHDTKPTDIE